MHTLEIRIYDLTPADEELLDIATSTIRQRYIAKRTSIAAALRIVGGPIITGVNIKEDSMQYTSCAEANAIKTAWGMGYTDFDTITSIKYEPDDSTTKVMNICGACAQLCYEHGVRRIVVYEPIAGVIGVVTSTRETSSLLPFAYRGTPRTG